MSGRKRRFQVSAEDLAQMVFGAMSDQDPSDRDELLGDLVQHLQRLKVSSAEPALVVAPEPVVEADVAEPAPPESTACDIQPGETEGLAVGLLEPYRLMPHQEKAIRWMMYRESVEEEGIRGGVLAAIMGLGKTLMALSLIRLCPRAPSHTTCSAATLYVCKHSLLPLVAGEAMRFFGPSMKVFPLSKDILPPDIFNTFDARFAELNHVVLVTYDTIRSLHKCRSDMASRFFGITWHRIVLDESHTVCNPSTQVFEAMHGIRAEHHLLMSGTPVRNCSDDLFAQLALCGLSGINLHKRKDWTVEHYDLRNLGRFVLSMTIEDSGVTLPPNSIHTVQVVMDEAALAVYQSALEAGRDIMRQHINKLGGIKWANVLVMFTRLRQVCNSPSIVDPSYPVKESPKVKAVVRLLQENIPADECVVVFSSWTTTLKIVYAAIVEAIGEGRVLYIDSDTKRRGEVLSEFCRTESRSKVLCITSDIGKEGLTLTRANHVIIVEPHWNSTVEDQAAARINRISQERPTHLWRMLTVGSIEQKMASMCEEKRKLANAMVQESGITMEELASFF